LLLVVVVNAALLLVSLAPVECELLEGSHQVVGQGLPIGCFLANLLPAYRRRSGRGDEKVLVGRGDGKVVFLPMAERGDQGLRSRRC
jgi:hypothetical protein